MLGLVVSTAALLASLLLASTASLGLAVDDQVACGVHPLDVVLIIDRSGSMQTEQSGGHTRNYWSELAANQLVDDLDGGAGNVGDLHHIGLTTFGGVTATNNLALGSSDAAAVHTAITAISASGNTPLKLGLATGAGNMLGGDRDFHEGVSVLQVLIMLSDGRPVPSPAQRPNAGEIDAYLASADVAYSIAIGEGGSDTNTQVDLALMQLLDKPDGGFRHVVDADDLPGLFSDIFTELTCPQIGIDKSPSVGSVPAGGGEVTYSYAVTNSNPDAPLSNVTVIDDKCAPVNYVSGDSNTDSKLQSSETWMFSCTMVLTETTHNVATASGVFNDVSFTAQDTADVIMEEPVATPTPTPVEEEPTPTPTPVEEEPTPTPTPVEEEPTPTPTPTPEESVEGGTPSPTPEQSVSGGTPAPSLPNSATGQSDGSSPMAAIFFLIALGSLLMLPLANIAVARRRR